ncbi:MAG: hypothetical protein JNM34_05690 [Chthonomonadaceae bacterium]|nr:hypothetical protein [Chthonomonadaceae bacterium]
MHGHNDSEPLGSETHMHLKAKQNTMTVLGAAVLLSVAGMTIARAQSTRAVAPDHVTDAPPIGQPFRPAGGPAVMVADQQFLFILRGDELIKVDKGSLKIAGRTGLPGPKWEPAIIDGQPAIGAPERIKK